MLFFYTFLSISYIQLVTHKGLSVLSKHLSHQTFTFQSSVHYPSSAPPSLLPRGTLTAY